jgi:hypothetical protein
MTHRKSLPSGRRLYAVRLAAMVAAVLGMAAAAPVPARATLIDYVFNDNGGLQYNAGGSIVPVFLTGDFTYDTVANALTVVAVTFTGGGSSAAYGTYTSLFGSLVNGPTDVQFYGPDSRQIGSLSFRLSQVLGTTGRVDLLPGWLGWSSGPPYSLTPFFPSFVDPANPPFVTGTEVNASTIPEPASILVVGLGCGLVVQLRRSRRGRDGAAGELAARRGSDHLACRGRSSG